jgi:uncharacterized membrane protein YdfJ with MMPL/SSD domain
MFSTLRFQAEMAQLLVVLMIINMLGAITVVPAFYSIFQPKVATSLRRAPTSDSEDSPSQESEPEDRVCTTPQSESAGFAS